MCCMSSCVTCHVLHITCCMSYVRWHVMAKLIYFLDKIAELVSGGREQDCNKFLDQFAHFFLHIFHIFCIPFHTFCTNMHTFCTTLHIFCTNLHTVFTNSHIFCTHFEKVLCLTRYFELASLVRIWHDTYPFKNTFMGGFIASWSKKSCFQSIV